MKKKSFLRRFMHLLCGIIVMFSMMPLQSFATTRLYLDNIAIPYGTKIYFTDGDGVVNLGLTDGTGAPWPLFKIYYNGNLIYEYGNFVYYHTPNDTYHDEDDKWYTDREFVICQEEPALWSDSRWTSNYSSSGTTWTYRGLSYAKQGTETLDRFSTRSIPTMTGEEIHVYPVLTATGSYNGSSFVTSTKGGSYSYVITNGRHVNGNPIRCLSTNFDNGHVGNGSDMAHVTWADSFCQSCGTRWTIGISPHQKAVYDDVDPDGDGVYEHVCVGHEYDNSTCDECDDEVSAYGAMSHAARHNSPCQHITRWIPTGYDITFHFSVDYCGQVNAIYDLTLESQNTDGPDVMKVWLGDDYYNESSGDDITIEMPTDDTQTIRFSYDSYIVREGVSMRERDYQTWTYDLCTNPGFMARGDQDYINQYAP